MIAYTSIYGNTKKSVEVLESKLREKGCPEVVVCDLAREDMSKKQWKMHSVTENLCWRQRHTMLISFRL